VSEIHLLQQRLLPVIPNVKIILETVDKVNLSHTLGRPLESLEKSIDLLHDAGVQFSEEGFAIGFEHSAALVPMGVKRVQKELSVCKKFRHTSNSIIQVAASEVTE
jgi:hypothetical protein